MFHVDLTYPFAVDCHLHVRVESEACDLGNVANALHVRGIAARTEDASNTRLGVHVVRRDERARGITCQRDDFRRDGLLSRRCQHAMVIKRL